MKNNTIKDITKEILSSTKKEDNSHKMNVFLKRIIFIKEIKGNDPLSVYNNVHIFYRNNKYKNSMKKTDDGELIRKIVNEISNKYRGQVRIKASYVNSLKEQKEFLKYINSPIHLQNHLLF